MRQDHYDNLKVGDTVVTIKSLTRGTKDSRGVFITPQMVQRRGSVMTVSKVNKGFSVQLSDGCWYGPEHIRYPRGYNERV